LAELLDEQQSRTEAARSAQASRAEAVQRLSQLRASQALDNVDLSKRIAKAEQDIAKIDALLATWPDVQAELARRVEAAKQASYLRGKRYNMEKSEHGGDRKSSSQNDYLKTVEVLAEEFKVSPSTIQRDGKFAAAVDTLADTIGDEARTAVLSGNRAVRILVQPAVSVWCAMSLLL
jgi:hypothetical protein